LGVKKKRENRKTQGSVWAIIQYSVTLQVLFGLLPCALSSAGSRIAGLQNEAALKKKQ